LQYPKQISKIHVQARFSSVGKQANLAIKQNPHSRKQASSLGKQAIFPDSRKRTRQASRLARRILTAGKPTPLQASASTSKVNPFVSPSSQHSNQAPSIRTQAAQPSNEDKQVNPEIPQKEHMLIFTRSQTSPSLNPGKQANLASK
jgi:hypothetical protein